MKRFFLFFALMAVCFCAGAQEDRYVFNHIGVGVDVGTQGFGLEVAAPVTKFLAVRTGVSFMPNIKVRNIKVDIQGETSDWREDWESTKQNVRSYVDAYSRIYDLSFITDNPDYQNYMNSSVPDKVLIDGKLGMLNWKLLLDVYPFRGSSFHLTGGFYYGRDEVVDAYTTNCRTELRAITFYNRYLAGLNYNPLNPSDRLPDEYGIEVGDYLLVPNGEKVEACIRTNRFKPYVGFGFGRAVPHRHRLAFSFDLGAMFWGTPKVFVDQPGGERQIEKNDFEGKDGGAIRIISKVNVYPCLTFRLSGRIF